jgi:predicted O-methyltransferase YrrM
METPDWDRCLSLVRTINGHYGLRELDQQIIFNLIKNAKAGSVFVEIGVCHGRTAAMLAYIALCRESEYHGIDIFRLDGATKAEVSEKLSSLGLPFTIHEGSSNENGNYPLACPNWTKPIDVLLIDGGHDEANVKADCEIWLPRLRPGGLAIFDDWNSADPHTNAHWAIKYYSDFYCPGWEILNTNHKTHIRRKPF